MKQLESSLVKVDNLTASEKDQMYRLMFKHFDGVSRTGFARDLGEKKGAIILRDKAVGSLQGFSTYMLLEGQVIDGIKVAAIFSGDTIIDRSHWGCWELFKAFSRLGCRLHEQYQKNNTRLYWFLVSMGYRTYRLLPAFFREFYPRYDKPTPSFEKKIINVLAGDKFSSAYNSQTGVIHFSKGRERLKENLANVAREKLRNAHINFFCRQNPGYKYGDELACLAGFSQDNLGPVMLKIISG